MAPNRPVPIPSVPASAPVVGQSYMPAVWILFFNKIVDFIQTLTQRGLRADQPAATDVYPGTLYFVTDESVTERSNGDAWETFS